MRLWVRIAAIASFAAAPLYAAEAGTYYVASDGQAENDGSREKPWPSVEYALSKVGGGRTIIVRPGIYRGPIEIGRPYGGTEGRPTVIRSEAKWQAVIVGAPYHGISNAGDVDWVVVDGFQVLGARYDGIKMSGDHNVVRNCWVHHNQAMGIAMHNRRGGTIEANLIEFNGGHIQFDHGVYADGEGLTIRRNVVRHNASFGLHLYRSIRDSLIADNIVYGQVRRRGIILACPEGGGRNRILHNTVVEEEPIAIWKGRGEVVANNILVARAGGEAIAFDEATRDVFFDFNLCIPSSSREGPRGVSADPLFVDPVKGLFWLRPGSPAIGKGSIDYATPTDFWGRPRPSDRPPDLGAAPYVPFLATDSARALWEYGWGYFRHGEGGRAPDFWGMPLEGKP